MEPVADARRAWGPPVRFFAGLPRVAPPGPWSCTCSPLRGGWRTATRAVPVGVPSPCPEPFATRGQRPHPAPRPPADGAPAQTPSAARLGCSTCPAGGSPSGCSARRPSAPSPARAPCWRCFDPPRGRGGSAVRLLDVLGWSSVVDPAELARVTGLSDAVRASPAWAWLSASGSVGPRPGRVGAGLHRELPVDSRRVSYAATRGCATHEGWSRRVQSDPMASVGSLHRETIDSS